MSRKDTLIAMLKENPKDSFIRFALAKEREKEDDIHGALSLYDKIIDDDPNYIGVYYHLAKCYELIEKDEVAIKIYEDGINVAQSLGDAHAMSELKSAKLNLELGL